MRTLSFGSRFNKSIFFENYYLSNQTPTHKDDCHGKTNFKGD